MSPQHPPILTHAAARGPHGKVCFIHRVNRHVLNVMGLQAAGRDKLFLVFSDDIEWCKRQELFSALEWVAFVELGVDFLELRLMALCDHHIIAKLHLQARRRSRARPPPPPPRASRLRLTAQPPPPPSPPPPSY